MRLDLRWRAPAVGQGTPWRWILALWLLIELVYAFYASAGTFRDFPASTDYYDRLAEAFRHGQLNLLETPSPELLAKANPWDFKHRALWMWDISLHQGKYYLYWGPLPALLQAIGKSLLRVNRIVGDQFIQHFFFSLSALFGALLIERVARRLFETVPRWLVALCIVAFGLVNPVLYMTATPSVYHTAIAGGQACLLGGALVAFDAVSTPPDGARRPWRLLPAGVAFGLALGCRLSLAPTIAIIGLATAFASQWSRDGWPARVLGNALVLGVPVAVCLLALGLYNRARFGDFLETGLRLQLTTMKFRASPDYVLANLYAYVAEPYKLSCRFPYAWQSWESGRIGLPAWFPDTPGYIQEPVAGWFVTAPISWLLPLSPVVAATALGRMRSLAWRSYVFCAVCFAVMASVTGVAELGLYVATMRYLADVSYGVVLLGVLGGFTLLARPRREPPRRGWLALVAALAGATIVTSLLLGIQGYDGQFRVHNRALYDQLSERLSLCGPRGERSALDGPGHRF